jgi:hypothetical protein
MSEIVRKGLLPMTVIVEHNGDKFYNVCFKQKGLTGEDRPDIGNVYVPKFKLDGDELELKVTVEVVKRKGDGETS